MDFWTHNFQATVISTICSPLALKIHNVIVNMMEKWGVKFFVIICAVLILCTVNI